MGKESKGSERCGKGREGKRRVLGELKGVGREARRTEASGKG